MNLISNTPEELFNYFHENTLPRHYSIYIEDGFWNFWGNFKTKIDLLIESLSELTLFLKNNIYLCDYEESGKISSLSDEIKDLIILMGKLYAEANNPKGWFKSHKVKKSIEEGDKELRILNRKLLEINQLVEQISKKYPKTFEEKRLIIIGRYPCLDLRTIEDFHVFLKFEKEHIFDDRLFILLNKYMFPLMKEKSLTISRLDNLLQKLRDPIIFRRYFFNVVRFRKMLSEEAFDKVHYEDENLFFDNQFFDIIGYLVIPIRIDKIYSNHLIIIYHLKNFLDQNRAQGKDNENKRAYLAVKRLSQTNIKIDHSDTGEAAISMIFDFLTEGTVDLLVLTGIREIRGYVQISFLRDISVFAQNCNDFKEDKIPLSIIWNRIIKKSARDIYHLTIFIKMYFYLGKQYLLNFSQKKIQLSSYHLHDLEVLMGHTNQKEIQSQLENLYSDSSGRDRKLILITAPRTDWNLAFNRLYGELKKIPKDKYEVHFSYITTINQLALIIREVSEKRPIDILIISGHGSPEGTTFSYRNQGYLDKKALESKLFEDIHLCFSKDAVCYFFSCSTGKGENPIADFVAEKFKIKTIAPKEDTPSIIQVTTDGKLIISYMGDIEPKMVLPK